MRIGLKGGFGEGNLEGKPDWERHLRIADLARAFGTTGRVLRDEEDEEEVDKEDIDMRGFKGDEVKRMNESENVNLKDKEEKEKADVEPSVAEVKRTLPGEVASPAPSQAKTGKPGAGKEEL